MDLEGTANTPFIENPQMEEWECSESMQTPETVQVILSASNDFMMPTECDSAVEIFCSTVHEKEHWCTSDDLEALEEGFREGDACHAMLSVKDDTDERLPLYCRYVNGRLETVYRPLEGPYEFDHIEDLTSSSDL